MGRKPDFFLFSREQIEGLKLFDPQHYPPLIPGTNKSYPVPIIPKNLYEVFSGKVKYSVAIKDNFKYGGDKEKEKLCADLTSGYADKQWQSVTLGHFLSHRTGLPRSAPNLENDIVPNLRIIRNLKTQENFQNQEKVLRQQWGSQTINSAKSQLGLTSGKNGYFIPEPTLSEIMMVLAGRCLRYPLGKFNYSNTSPAFPTIILKELMASGRYGADLLGKPETHKGSALQIFFQQLGVPTTATEGVFITPLVQNFPGDREPKKRHWNGKSYYGTAWDVKRPHCVWTGKFCDFTSWVDKKPGTINWSWNLKQVPFAYAGAGIISPGTGSLAAEPKAFLKFMSEYWLAGYDANPFVGEKRNSTWNQYAAHNGAYDGTYAEAIQLGGSNNPKSWALPPLDQKGRILDVFDKEKLTTYKTSLPDGVDIFVAVNQLADRKCVEADKVNTKEKGYNCSDAYGMLNNFVLYGASRVNWAQVKTVNDKLGF